MKLNDIPRVRLAHLPTALDEASGLAAAIGLSKLYIKRDDNTGLATGGNKARKLEFLMADAQAQGAQVVMTCGGAQSNHARQTAAAACKLGMKCILFLTDPMPETFEGNLLLDAILDAEIRFLPGADYEGLLRTMHAEEEKLASQGIKSYSIPVGGSSPIGAMGYVAAMQEIAGQLEDPNADIVFGVGSSGTLAGMILGQRLFLPESRLLGISVSRDSFQCMQRGVKIANQAAKMIGVEEEIDSSATTIHDEYIGEAYAVPTQAGKDAILLTARTEGVILDPVYTGKTMAGLIDLAKKGQIGKDRPVVFWHTGGAAGLFAFHELFEDEARRLSSEIAI
jgi:D-cysteine desulfhydrase family pyridoxal phosphate-dependent enzyme